MTTSAFCWCESGTRQRRVTACCRWSAPTRALAGGLSLQIKSGSHGRTRTCTDRLTAERPTVGRHGNDWWSTGESNSARRSCKDHLQPAAYPVVPGVGFEPTSPRFQRGAFTRSASQANWCGRRESNPDLKSGALALCLRAAPAWWGMGRVERLAARDGVYSAATGPPVLIGIPRSWLQVAESNRAQNGS